MIWLRYHTKRLFWTPLLVSLLSAGCSGQNQKSTLGESAVVSLKVPDTLINKAALIFNHQTSIWTLDGLPYSGYAVTYYPDNSLKEKFGILDGKKQNKFIQWFPDGNHKNMADYHQGKLHGEKRVWTRDSTHMLIAHFNYHEGKPHGEQKKWYPTGELFKILNLDRGKEEGIQQAFRKNGDIYANYEALEGRIFGLKKATLCYGLEDEQIQTTGN